jgi:hypothetical protein
MATGKYLGGFSLSVLVALFCSTQVALAQSELPAKVEVLADKLTSSISGEVAAVEGEVIYINLGERDGVSEDSQFEVVRLGEIVMVGNKTIHKERPIGEIQITKVRKDMSLATTTTSSAQIEKGDKVYQKRKKVTRIALTEFPYGDGLNNLTKNVYESLSITFAQKGMQVVERSQIEKVFQEQKLSHSGLIDLSTAQKMGQLLGTEAIVLGTTTDMGNNVAIRARLVDVGKGVVIAAAQVEVTKNPEILAMLGMHTKGVGRNESNGPVTGQRVSERDSIAVTSTGGPGSKEKAAFENSFLKIDVLAFRRTAEGLILRLSYRNQTKQAFRMALIDPNNNTYLVDDAGNQYPFKESELGDQQHWLEFAPGVPRISTIVFRDIKTGGADFIFTAKHQIGFETFFASIKGLSPN